MSKSLPNLVFEFKAIEPKENVEEFESKYCRSNPLNNVPWARDDFERSEDVFENCRIESPTQPDLSNWAALILENNPPY